MSRIYETLGVVQPLHFALLVFGCAFVVVGSIVLVIAMIKTLREEKPKRIVLLFLLVFPWPVIVMAVIAANILPREYSRAFGL